MLKIEYGDLLQKAIEGEFDVIVHGCNCFHKMGAGIAAQIKRKFPQAFLADEQTEYGDPSKVGTYSISLVDKYECPFIVVNAYTQFNPGADARYDAIGKFMLNFKRVYGKMNLRIGVPEIGCGIGGLSSPHVRRMIEDIWSDMDVTMVIFQP